MTAVPPPDVPCVRVNFAYIDNNSNLAGNRLFFSYTGGPPTSADLNSLATAIAAAWTTHIAPLQCNTWGLQSVDVLDIATDSGASGVWNTGSDGSRGDSPLPAQVAFIMKYNIGRRYRGGKPKGYFPWGIQSDQLNQAEWTTTLTAAALTNFTAFIAAVVALSEPSINMQNHVNLSYYQGFKNITNSSGRERAAPTYRTTAKHDVITGYSFDQRMGSQRRRRSSLSP